MGGLVSFVETLFAEGRVHLDARPDATAREREGATEVLRRAFEDDAIDLPGPPLKFDATIATIAAEWTRRACWFLVSRAEPGEVVERALTLLPRPREAGQHLAADLTFRYLPLVHRRARATAPDDLLTTRLVELLRQWPLSGVLADVHDAPSVPPDFGGHAGLLMRYAERLSRNEKPAWVPRAGSPGLGYFELVGGRARVVHDGEPVDA